MVSRRLNKAKILPIIIIYSFCTIFKRKSPESLRVLTSFSVIIYILKNLSWITCTAFSASLRSTITDILISLVEIMLILMPPS